MPHTPDNTTENLFPLGHSIVALHHVISRDLTDHNYTSADHHIDFFDDLTNSIDALTDTEARHVLIGILKALQIRHTVAREDTLVPDTPPDTFIPGTLCGHRHTLGNYANGCAHATHLAWAIAAAHNGNHHEATHHALIADGVLTTLADINNPDSLRDFIAGNASGLEAHLRTLGTTIKS